MAIKWQWRKLPVDENGKAYESLDEFKIALIQKLFEGELSGALTPRGMAEIVWEQTNYIREIFDITEDSRPSARGVPKPRKNKTKPAAEPELPIKAA